MRVAAKWFIIGWTLICLAGGSATCFFPFVTAAHDQASGKVKSEAEREAQAVAVGGCATCGIFGWFVIWVIGTVPGIVFYAIGKPTQKIVAEDYGRAVPPIVPIVLCSTCGKYRSGDAAFCPHCGVRSQPRPN